MSEVMRKTIMDMLLARYEKSGAFRGTRARLYLDASRDGELFDKLESYDFKDDFLRSAKSLEKEGLVRIEWLKGEEGNLPERIRLTALDNGLMDRAYEVAGRLDLAHSLDALKQALLSFSHSCTSVQLCDHALALVSYIDSRRSLPKPFNGNVEEDGKLLELLLAIAANDEEKGERVFSSRFFGDSKTFEKQWKDRVLIFLRQAFRDEGVEGDEELLSLFSLRRYPAILPFRGNARLVWKEGPVTQWRHCMGVGYLDTSSLDLLEGIEIDDAAVLSIENKETFYGLKAPEGLFVVYHGGFSGKAARQWHRMLASNRCRFFHWGDIDLGGMDIFVQLKGDIPALEPFLMDVDTLERYSDKAQKLGGKAYRDRLSSRQGKEGYEVFDDLVARMLDEDRRLEQENISVDEATLEALLV